jgi:hypothetical protein
MISLVLVVSKYDACQMGLSDLGTLGTGTIFAIFKIDGKRFSRIQELKTEIKILTNWKDFRQ